MISKTIHGILESKVSVKKRQEKRYTKIYKTVIGIVHTTLRLMWIMYFFSMYF